MKTPRISTPLGGACSFRTFQSLRSPRTRRTSRTCRIGRTLRTLLRVQTFLTGLTHRSPKTTASLIFAFLVLAAFLSACAPLNPPRSEDFSNSFKAGPTQSAAMPGGAWPTTGSLVGAVPIALPPEGPLKLTVNDAILIALGNNQTFQMQLLQPELSRTSEDQALAAFDPVLSAGIQGSRTRVEGKTATGQDVHTVSEDVHSNAGVSEFLPTGTNLSLDATNSRSHGTNSSNQDATRVGLSVTQSLLQGAGLGPNLASLRQARLDTRASEYELRGVAEQTVASVEETYWDYTLAARQIEIVQQALDVAQRQLQEAEERVKVGKLAASELFASRAEVALRKENMINARSTLAQTRLQLLHLLNPPGKDLWNRKLDLVDKPEKVEVQLGNVEDHVEVAMRWRPDLNQARLQIERDDLEIVKTRNGLLPVLDLFITLGKTGYANSFNHSVKDLDNDSYDATIGADFSYAIFNRAARARNEAAHINRRLASQSLANLEQLAQVDVRSAYIEVNRTEEQVAATAAARHQQQESLRVENEKFLVGKSTSLLVAQAQRDLLTSQIAEIQAIVNHHHAIVELYRLEGSLLERRGIEAPGEQPVLLKDDVADANPPAAPAPPKP